MKKLLSTLLILLLLVSCENTKTVKVTGQLKKWHKVTLEIKGPEVAEYDQVNPFLDYRIDATFTNGTDTIKVPGYFAADGNSAETSSKKGNIWKIHFCPNDTGNWTYTISFKSGKAVSIADNSDELQAVSPDGVSGSFTILPSDKTGSDFRAKGQLKYVGKRYLQFSETGEFFLKGGADSPENFLGYTGFDDTWYGGTRKNRIGESAPNKGLHAYEPHIADWNEGDPTWQDGKGKGIIGALNYLASKGMNSVYFLTMNILGDGEDVWPYTDRNERYRFDCSKLDQWEKVFSHADSLGIMLHVVLQETENECLLDAGYLDVQRKLYLRELIARFSHHLAITWNLGEEHFSADWSPYGQTYSDTKKMATWLRENDPYNHFIVVHTHSNIEKAHENITNLLGYKDIDGPSIQVGSLHRTHDQTLKWINLSADSSHQWVVCLDEIGPAHTGALPDAVDPDHDTIRAEVLWGNLMAGGAGVEWYFGYKYPHNDLNCEDWRSRNILWDQTRYALDFFRLYLPFSEMKNTDELVQNSYCLSKKDEIYAIYIPYNRQTTINLTESDHEYMVDWYDPKNGGDLQEGSLKTVKGGKIVSPGLPPNNDVHDWVCLLRKK